MLLSVQAGPILAPLLHSDTTARAGMANAPACAGQSMVPLADIFNHKAAVVHLGEGSGLLTGLWLPALVPVCASASHHLPLLLCSVYWATPATAGSLLTQTA